jgi:hypothetical protein
VAMIGKLVQKWESDSYIQKEKQYTKQEQRTHKIENKYKNKKTNIKRTSKNASRPPLTEITFCKNITLIH